MASVTSSRSPVSPLSANRPAPESTVTLAQSPTAKVSQSEPREITKADICNVEFLSARDLDSIFDSLIEATSFQHALEDCECGWTIADVDPELMDLRDPPKPFKSATAWRDVVPFRAKRR